MAYYTIGQRAAIFVSVPIPERGGLTASEPTATGSLPVLSIMIPEASRECFCIIKMKKSERKALGRGLRALISPDYVSVGNLATTSPKENSEGGALGGDESLKEESGSGVPLSGESNPIPVKGASVPSVDTSKALSSDEPKGTGSELSAEGLVRFLPLSHIDPNPEQPRKEFLKEELEDLVESIESLGVLQPILVRPSGKRFEVVAGERRWRAAQTVGLESIPAIIRELDEKETLQISLVENVQRQQLSPIEEALGYQRLIDEFDLTQEEVAELVGKRRASIANVLRVLTLDQEVQGLLQGGKLTLGHAKVILGVKDPAAQRSLARKVSQEGLSVRALEGILPRMVVLDRGKAVKPPPEFLPKEPLQGSNDGEEFGDVIDRLRLALGTRVSIQHQTSKDRGRIVVEYFSSEELERIVEQLCEKA